MGNDAIAQLIEWLRSASPELWRILIREVYIEAGGNIFLGTAIVGVLVALHSKYNRWKKEGEEEPASAFSSGIFDNDDRENVHMWGIILWVVTFFIGLFAMIAYSSALQSLLNPEYQAVLLIISRLK